MNEEFNPTPTENLEAEDSLPEELVEDTSDEAQELDTVLGEETEQGPEEKQPQSAGGQKEPGYVRNRINEAVSAATKSLQDELAALRAQMEPLREYQLNAEAQELVRSGKVKDLETAKELVRYRQGQPGAPATQTKTEQPRQANGQFAPSEQKYDPATQARLDMLNHQADRIKAAGGPDVRDAFLKDETIKQKVSSGEMDFYDVADYLKNQKSSRKKPPSPTRSPNGASNVGPMTIENMSDAQFAKLDKMLEEGKRFTYKR